MLLYKAKYELFDNPLLTADFGGKHWFFVLNLSEFHFFSNQNIHGLKLNVPVSTLIHYCSRKCVAKYQWHYMTRITFNIARIGRGSNADFESQQLKWKILIFRVTHISGSHS